MFEKKHGVFEKKHGGQCDQRRVGKDIRAGGEDRAGIGIRSCRALWATERTLPLLQVK